MSINLTLEKPEATTEEPAIRYTKRIDDLIEDAEIEAEIEAERKVRAKNTKIVAIAGVAISLLVFLYYGIQSQSGTTTNSPAKADKDQVAKLAAKAPPKPIPFPASDESAVPEIKPVAKVPAPATSSSVAPPPANAPAKKAESAQSAKTKSPAEKAPISFSGSSSKTVKKSSAIGTTLQAMNLPPARDLKAPGSRAKATPVATVSSGYFVQVGAFSSKANADRLANKLKKAGFAPSFGQKTVDNKLINVVRLGGFSSSAKAKSAKANLSKAGYKNSFVFYSKKG